LRTHCPSSDRHRGLTAVLECVEDMRDRQKVALIIDEKRVAEKRVVITMRRGRFVKAINDRADRGCERAIGAGLISTRSNEQACRPGDRSS